MLSYYFHFYFCSIFDKPMIAQGITAFWFGPCVTVPRIPSVVCYTACMDYSIRFIGPVVFFMVSIMANKSDANDTITQLLCPEVCHQFRYNALLIPDTSLSRSGLKMSRYAPLISFSRPYHNESCGMSQASGWTLWHLALCSLDLSVMWYRRKRERVGSGGDSCKSYR